MLEPNESRDQLTHEIWLREALPRAVAFARSLLRERDLAEDIVHDCVCRLLARATAYDLPRDGVKLLFTSVTNACINAVQRERPLIRLDDSQSPNGPADESLADQRGPSPMDEVMTGELRAAIAQALNSLPVQQRAAIELKSMGLSLADIGESLSVTPNHAGVLVHRARQALRQLLANHLKETR